MNLFGKKYNFVALYSGGLDSSLAIKLMTSLGYSVLGVKFAIPFMPGKRVKESSLYFNEELSADIFVLPLGDDYIAMVRSPRFGYGDNMNPCVDCKIFFLRRAKTIMEEVGAKGIITGEVLGQRPMSQNIRAMHLIEKESGLIGRILRPLSAGLLEPTEIERSGFVNRESLLKLSGRSRKQTLLIASQLGIKNFGSPSGGCLLTDPAYSTRLKDAFRHNEFSLEDVESLKFGRHFRFESGAKLIVGRNKSENEYLMELCKNKILIEPYDTPGPSCFLSMSATDDDIILAGRICARYSDKKNEENVPIIIKKGQVVSRVDVVPAPDELVKKYIITIDKK